MIISNGARLLVPFVFYFIGNCSVALGHRSKKQMKLSARIGAAHRLLFYGSISIVGVKI